MSDHNSVFGHSAPTDSEPQSSSTQSLRPAKIVLGLAITLLAVWFVWWLFSGKSEPDKLGWGGVTCENPIGASTPIRDVWEAHSFKEVYFCLYRLPTGDRLKIKRVRPNGEVLLIELDEHDPADVSEMMLWYYRLRPMPRPQPEFVASSNSRP